MLVHGLSSVGGRHTPEYRSWYDMVRRTIDPNCPNWKWYGGRGIQVCYRWHKSNPNGFVNFLHDMGAKPSREYRIERINNDGHYMPSNCEWSTQKQQCRNTSKNHFLTVDGTTKCISEWSAISGVSAGTISFRKRIGKTDRESVYGAVKQAEVIYLTVDGRKHSISEWAKRVRKHRTVIYYRFKKGWSDYESVYGRNRR